LPGWKEQRSIVVTLRLAIASALVLCVAAHGQTPWQSAPAAALGLDGAKLEALRADMAVHGTKALLIARRGRIALEWYAEGHDAKRKQGTASLAKSLVGGLSLTLLVQDGAVKWDDRASKWIASWRGDARKSKITLRHLASHTSGLEDAEIVDIPHEKLPGWKGAFWKRDPNPFLTALNDAPVLYEPGTAFHYSNTGMAALSYALTAALREARAPQQSLQDLLRARVMEPLEIPDEDWSIGYGRAYETDGLPVYASWGGGSFTPRATARIGQMLAEGGRTGERVILRPARIAEMKVSNAKALPERSAANPWPRPAMGWYTNEDGIWPGIPRDAFCGAGAGDQTLLVVPSLGLVVVRNGEELDGVRSRDSGWGPRVAKVYKPAVAALLPDGPAAPYSPSTRIGGVEWAPASEIRIAAEDSDNWPVTWMEDGDQFTSYGDGRGFAPFIDRKLSMGWARIKGGPGDFTGLNFRSESGERMGDGARGAKVSGVLMVGGVLYAFARNTDNSQLLWSEDQGKTWTWGWKWEKGFASPSFLQYGANYAGARDGFVYVYSQSGDSAYHSDDGVLLARVPKERIRGRDAWEYFVEQKGESAVWSKEIANASPVWKFPAHAQRVDAVYSQAFGRVLLLVGYDHSGGWGIYDAPAAWGPWTTAFHTNDWGLGDTHGYRLPAKWMANETMYLIFSGSNRTRPNYDAFCVRRFRLLPRR